MDTLAISLFSIFFFITHTTSNTCTPSSCHPTGSPQVRFPFNLLARQPDSCGFPGYNLHCNNKNQTILNLPSGQVIVKRISYPEQSIIIDPQFCLPNRINDFSLDGTHFFSFNLNRVTFFNCSSELVELRYAAVTPVTFRCLSGSNHTVFALPTYYASEVPASCRNIATIVIPVRRSQELSKQELELRWFLPECGSCESDGGTCGISTDAITCHSGQPGHTRGLSRSVLYGLLGLGAATTLCIVVFIIFFIKKKLWGQSQSPQQGQRRVIDLSSISIALRPNILMGLNGPTIESYPKTVLGDSRRLPRPNDGTCSICLSDYQSKDELRTIPECNHYFHAECIDEWLRLNAICPLCRNKPESAVVMPCTSTSSPASTSSNRNTRP